MVLRSFYYYFVNKSIIFAIFSNSRYHKLVEYQTRNFREKDDLLMVKIGVVVGSIRENSFSQQWADNIVTLYPDGTEIEFLKIADLPLYNQDYDEKNIPEYTDFRAAVKGLDGVLFVTPEHNRSIPAALKNALDVASRPWGENVWAEKPAMIASHSISGISGFGANHHLRQMLTFLDMPTVKQPEVYLGNSQDLLDEEGKAPQDTLDFLQSAVDAHVDLINKLN